MAKGFYFDMTTCIGCRTCQVACKDKNESEIGVNFRQVKSYETGEYPEADLYHYSSSCNHCDKPACVEKCPTGAMYKTEEGAVVVDNAICVGCETCLNECPYGAPKYIKSEGKVGKCDSCYALRQDGQNPACVDACIMRCLKFGEIDEMKEKGMVRDLPILPSSKDTKPNVLIKPRKAALEKNFEEHQV